MQLRSKQRGFWGELLGGIGGSLLGGLFGKSAQASANRTNIKLQRENQDWMKMMSDTSYQRGVTDLTKSGLNPMLAYSQGGASTPSSSAATVIPEDAMGKGIASAADKAFQAVALRKLEQETRAASEHADQQEIVTEDMKNVRGLTGGRPTHWENIASEADLKKYQAAQAKLQNEIADLDKTRKTIENEILQQTKGAQVQSAQAQAKLLEREVTFKELQTLLGQLDLPEKRAIAAWFERMGQTNIAARSAMTITQWLQMIFGRSR